MLLYESFIYIDRKLLSYPLLTRVGLSNIKTSFKIPSSFWHVSLHTMFCRNFFCSKRDLRNSASLEKSIEKYQKRYSQAKYRSIVTVFVILCTSLKSKGAVGGLKMLSQVKNYYLGSAKLNFAKIIRGSYFACLLAASCRQGLTSGIAGCCTLWHQPHAVFGPYYYNTDSLRGHLNLSQGRVESLSHITYQHMCGTTVATLLLA